MQEQEQNRTEQATPFKLNEARKRGQVAKSLEFNTLIMVAALIAVTAIAGKRYWLALCQLSTDLFNSIGTLLITSETVGGVLDELTRRTFAILLPILIVGVAAALLANWIQTGPIISGDPLKPKFERLNPAAGFKRVINKRMLFEAFKSVLKLIFLGAIAFWFFVAMLPSLPLLSAYAADGEANWLGSSALNLLFRLGLGLLAIGLIDIAFVRWQYSRQMMMSRRELKEEVKRREGDPQIRAKIRELQRENLKQARSMGRLPDADVLITNPSHFAVALRYDRDTMNAPIVLAKGSDNWVAEMKAIARKHGVPILERKRLARLLFKKASIDQPIPIDAFVDVARIYAELASARRNEARYEVARS